MKDEPGVSQQEIIEDLKARQRNTLWPDTMINSSSVDGFLWKGSENPPLVQRMGAWIFGITFMLLGMGMIEIDREIEDYRKSILAVIVGVVFFLAGMKVFRNGFRRRKAKNPSDGEDSN
jgi:hypothetical protein